MREIGGEGTVVDDIAEAVLAAIGGRENVLTNTVCMTRLRVTLKNPQDVDYEALNNVSSVLGTATRGANGLEVVFGPRVIESVYRAFLALTGIKAGTDALFPMSRQDSNFKVQINTRSRAASPSCSEQRNEWGSNHLDQSDIDTLKDLFAEDDSEEEEQTQTERSEESESSEQYNLLVINGPNVNMIGLGAMRDLEISDFSAILELCKETAREVGFSRCVCLQSNHEGDLVDWVQDAWGSYDAILINPTSYGSTSATLREAIRSVDIPTVLVGLDNDNRPSCLEDVCEDCITDKGIEGYAFGIRTLAQLCMW